jgi:2',3'-cyclic-nucleotide 2'-phosphodiesterase (5'-nucleotidase family)
MKFKKLLFACLIVTANISCSHKIFKITQATSTRIAIDSTTEAIADKNYEAYLLPTKQKIDAEMNEVIGQATESMRARKPESLLSNFSADVYRQAASDYLKEKVDLSVVNLGGLRTEVPAGNITVRKVFELMPFENELVILWLKGDKLSDLLNGFASIGGQGVSGLHMEISNGKAVNVTINGKPLDTNKLYTIATNDYLAVGNDNMLPLAMNEKRLNTGLKIRNVLMDYIKSETKKGNKIQSKLDGRIQ